MECSTLLAAKLSNRIHEGLRPFAIVTLQYLTLPNRSWSVLLSVYMPVCFRLQLEQVPW
jgi:hypothetical protein